MVPTDHTDRTTTAAATGTTTSRSHAARRPTARRRAERFVGAAVLAITVLVSAVACGDGNDGNDRASALCDARDHLTTSVQAVRDVDVVADGTDALRTAIADVRSAVDEVDQAAGNEFGDEVDAVRAAFDQLQSAVSALPNQPSVSVGVAAVRSAASGLATAVQTLADQTQSNCK